MKRMPRYGMQVTFVLTVCLALLVMSVQPVYAYEHTEKQAAIERAHEAIDALPEFPDIGPEHRAQVEEARRLVDAAYEAGATRLDLCIKGVLLEMIEEKLEKFVPDDDDVMPLPPTGGLAIPLGFVTGLILTGSGVLWARHSRKQQ